jgi:hypothetical protein
LVFTQFQPVVDTHGHSRDSKPPNRQVLVGLVIDGSSPRSPSCSIALSKRSSRPHFDLSGTEALTILRSIRVSAPSDRAALAVGGRPDSPSIKLVAEQS